MKKSIDSAVFEQLKNEIIRNRLHQGDKLSEEMLCERFHASRTPVRRAIHRLEMLGLVEVHDGVGTFVSMITEEDVKNAFEIRCIAEKYAAIHAIQVIPDSQIDQQEQIFLKIQSQLEKGGYGSSFEDMIQADWDLHDLIIHNSGNPLLAGTVEPVTILLRRCQFVYISQYGRATRDHLEIVHYLRKRDYPGLCAVLDRHLKFMPNT